MHISNIDPKVTNIREVSRRSTSHHSGDLEYTTYIANCSDFQSICYGEKLITYMDYDSLEYAPDKYVIVHDMQGYAKHKEFEITKCELSDKEQEFLTKSIEDFRKQQEVANEV